MKSEYNSNTHRYITIPNHSGDMPEVTLCAILKQVGITANEFTRK